MTIEKFLAILVKRWWLVLLCCLTVGAGAYIGSRLMAPLYQSTALIQVVVNAGNNPAGYENLLASEQLVETEATLATSDSVLREVASHYKGLTFIQLSGEVTATSKANTQLFEIYVQNSSPTQAATLANDVATTLIKQQTQAFRQNAVQGNIYLLKVQPAQPNFSPVRPHVLLNTGGGLVIGLLLGILLAVLYEQLDTRVRTPEALTQLLDWPVLATIWQARSSKKEDVFNPTEHDGNVEAYRILRTNIGFSGIDKPLHSLIVTSAMLCDGKSVIAANLAIFMAKAGKTTLLIDANLRRPIQHELFDLSSDKMGLSNAVLAFSTSVNANATSHRFFSSTVHTQPSNISTTTGLSLEPFIHALAIPNLWVMPSGPLPPNPSELLDSKAMQYLFTEIANCGIEMVIFDAPSLIGLSDSSILASKVDGTLVVVDITRANKGSLKQAKALLMQAGAHVVGCVVNKQRRKRKETLYYYYHTDGKSGKNHHTTENENSSAVPASIFAAPKNAVDLTVLDGRQGEDHES